MSSLVRSKYTLNTREKSETANSSVLHAYNYVNADFVGSAITSRTCLRVECAASKVHTCCALISSNSNATIYKHTCPIGGEPLLVPVAKGIVRCCSSMMQQCSRSQNLNTFEAWPVLRAIAQTFFRFLTCFNFSNRYRYSREWVVRVLCQY